MRNRPMIVAFAIVSVITPLLCAADADWIVRSRHGMVASDSPEASQIGAAVLANGGNAFDAVIATSFALAVARPHSTGLGGGGFMVAHFADGRDAVAVDFREVAPANATAERYAKAIAAAGDGPAPTVYGGYAVGVPGQLAGLVTIHERYATRPWPELVRPAIELAETGFVADESLVSACRSALRTFERYPALQRRCMHLYRTVLGRGKPPEVGARVRRSHLARALAHIARDGRDALYDGPIGQAIVDAVRSDGAQMRLSDLKRYQVKDRLPIVAPWRETTIVSMPPPSSGGVCIVETLNVLRALEESGPFVLESSRRQGTFEPALVFALGCSFEDRARFMGDPDFADVPIERLLRPDYAADLVNQRLQSQRGMNTQTPPDDDGTSHICVADQAGNVVALTETINGTFGSMLVAYPYGIILNNEMDDFTANPGEPNIYGLIQSDANAIAPGKRPLSSMSPTIVLRNGKPVLTLGASGGPRIITSVLQVMLGVLAFDQSLEESVAATRLHYQRRPDEVYFDREPPADVVERLHQAGHTVSDARKIGVVQAIQFLEDGTMVGASDPRKGGRPAGASE